LASFPAHPDGDQVAALPEPPALPDPIGPGVYVHVPFCHVRCPYCDFAVRPYDAAEAPLLARAAAAEARLRAPRATWGSLYFGGGTPSRLEPADFTALVRGLDDTLAFAPGHERSLEANPEDLDEARLAAWKAGGVTRLSIGVQSLDDAELARLGRVHDAAAVGRGVARARAAGFDDVSLDLMYAFPGHDTKTFGASLAHALALRPEHVSAYAYTAESGTPMGDAVRKGRLARPDEDHEAALFEQARETLEAAGFRHYEISNFARPGRETRHHLQYWRRGEYLGLGPSAVSFLAGVRVRAPRGLLEWARALEEGDAPRGWVVDDARPHALFETAFLGLRLDAGMRFADARCRDEDVGLWRAAAAPLVAQGFLAATADGFRIPRGERARTDAIVLLWRDGAEALGYTAQS
jgi:oxygen-independent coproporphyrinogen-3 oxidase